MAILPCKRSFNVVFLRSIGALDIASLIILLLPINTQIFLALVMAV